MAVDDTIVVCDAGGGTVDLISYTITRLNPILQVREAAGGTGGMCGSAFLNQGFRKFLKEKLSRDHEWQSWGEEDQEELLAEAIETFDGDVRSIP